MTRGFNNFICKKKRRKEKQRKKEKAGKKVSKKKEGRKEKEKKGKVFGVGIELGKGATWQLRMGSRQLPLAPAAVSARPRPWRYPPRPAGATSAPRWRYLGAHGSARLAPAPAGSHRDGLFQSLNKVESLG